LVAPNIFLQVYASAQDAWILVRTGIEPCLCGFHSNGVMDRLIWNKQGWGHNYFSVRGWGYVCFQPDEALLCLQLSLVS